MLNDMDKRTEHALDALKKQAREDSLKMERDEAADFFGQLADWAYAQSEAMILDDDLEMQDYENEY
jgi:hypothetical protein